MTLIASELTEPERRVSQAASVGALTDLRVGTPDFDSPATGASWGAERTVRADLLVDLLTGVHQPDRVARVRAVKLRGARITGTLNLEAITVVCPLWLHDCYFEQPINLQEAQAPSVWLPGCHLPGFEAAQLEVRGNLVLNNSFTADGEVRLFGAHIGGYLNLSGAKLTNPGGLALSAGRLTVDQDMSCDDGFTADGRVSLLGAHIGGNLRLSRAKLSNPGGEALGAAWLTVDQEMPCGDFVAIGEVNLRDSRIGGNLNLLHAKLTNPGGWALNAGGLTLGRDMFCLGGFTADGEVSLVDAHIGGNLSLIDAKLTNPGRPALNAAGLTVDQEMVCRKGFIADGEVRLYGARIGGNLDFTGAKLTNPGGKALSAGRLTVEGLMACRKGFTADGESELSGASIGELTFDGAKLTNPGGVALRLERLSAGVLDMLPEQPPVGVVNLTSARVGSLHDSQTSWPTTVHLRGFVYDTLDSTDQLGVRTRLRWLARDPDGYTPQPYEQLAAVYRRGGHEEAARRVAVAKHWHRGRTLNPLGTLWNWLLYVTVGYGYRTWLAAGWLAGLLAVGTLVFDRAYPGHMLAAKQPTPAFHPLAYTLDVLLPIVDLGQQDAWVPQGAALSWSWALTGAGWVLTTAVVAGLTRLLKRD
jgi:hypothetical protein